MSYRIDLFSDTMTKPGPEMRQAMAQAEVGDEQRGEDPTTNALQDRIAKLLGKERAVFLPTGVMCNQIAFRVHCQPGDEIIMDEHAHPRHFEVGAVSALSGAQVYPIKGERGIFTVEQAREAIRPSSLRNFPATKLISIEQTTNMGGGAVWPLNTIGDIAALASEHGIKMHMDGARLLHAVVKTGIPAAQWAAPFDSVWIDLSKGLGCPVGSVLAGSDEFVERAWRFKHQFGGAMRQSGFLCAAGLYALDHNVERLAIDHENARRLAESLARVDNLNVESPETNMVFFDVSATGLSAAQFNEKLMEKEIRLSPVGPSRLRAVTHLDLPEGAIDETIAAVTAVATGCAA